MKPANHLKFLNVFLHQINPWMTLCIYFSKTYVTPIIDPVNVDVKQKQKKTNKWNVKTVK